MRQPSSDLLQRHGVPAAGRLRWPLVTAILLALEIGAVASRAVEPEPGSPDDARVFTWDRLADLPDTTGVAGVFAGVCGDEASGRLVVAGGANFPDRPPWDGGAKTWHDAAWVLAEPGGRWQPATHLPAPLGYGVSATFGSRVWCVGGGDAKRHVATTVALGWDAAQRRLVIEPDALPALPRPMAYAAGVMVGSRLYVAGGQEKPDAALALGTLWSIDLAEPVAPDPGHTTTLARWQEHPRWPGPPRILPVLGTQAGRVYLVSGAELVAAPGAGASDMAAVTRRFLRDAYAFDPKTQTWTILAAPPVPIVAAAGPAIPIGGGRLAFLPGDDGELFERRAELAGRHPGFPRAIHLYDTAADTWLTAGEIPAAVGGTATATPVTTPAVAWRGRLVIPSGETQPGVRTPAVLTAAPRAVPP